MALSVKCCALFSILLIEGSSRWPFTATKLITTQNVFHLTRSRGITWNLVGNPESQRHPCWFKICILTRFQGNHTNAYIWKAQIYSLKVRSTFVLGVNWFRWRGLFSNGSQTWPLILIIWGIKKYWWLSITHTYSDLIGLSVRLFF